MSEGPSRAVGTGAHVERWAPSVTVKTAITLAGDVVAAKRLARRHQSQRNLLLLAGVLIGAAVGIAWLVVREAPSSDSSTALVAGFFGGAVLGSVAAWWLSRRQAPARCPRCGYSWEIREGRGVPISERMPYWAKCPGCSIPMKEWLVEVRTLRRFSSNDA